MLDDEDRPVVVDEELLNRAFCGQLFDHGKLPDADVTQHLDGSPRSLAAWVMERITGWSGLP